MIDILFVCLPFFFYNTPLYNLSLLTAVLKQKKISAQILYANLLYRKYIPSTLYDRISLSLGTDMVSEYIFADAAFPVLKDQYKKYEKDREKSKFPLSGIGNYLYMEELVPLKAGIREYLAEITLRILSQKPGIVGFNVSYNQICVSIALARYIKALAPSVITLIGGYHCQEPMATALVPLADAIDYLFCGEAEDTLPDVCTQLLDGKRLPSKLIRGTQAADLDNLPLPDYSDFFTAVDEHKVDRSEIILPVEYGRGCYWGEKSHCIFCGGIGANNLYRKKSPDLFRDQTFKLTEKYQCSHVFPTDMILARDFISRVLNPSPHLKTGKWFLECKPNLSLEELLILRENGVKALQPGIENLHDRLLEIMKKGTNALMNIRFMRDALSLGIGCTWVFIHSIPFERDADYAALLKVLPLLIHLQPPVLITHAIIQRFSPLYEKCREFGISPLRPNPVYHALFPGYTDFSNLALTFHSASEQAPLQSECKQKVISLVEQWQIIWHTFNPELALFFLGKDLILISDTRKAWAPGEAPGGSRFRFITGKHYTLLKKACTPIQEAELSACCDGLDSKDELKELLMWEYILTLNAACLSLVVEPEILLKEGIPACALDSDTSLFRKDAFLADLSTSPKLFSELKLTPAEFLKRYNYTPSDQTITFLKHQYGMH